MSGKNGQSPGGNKRPSRPQSPQPQKAAIITSRIHQEGIRRDSASIAKTVATIASIEASALSDPKRAVSAAEFILRRIQELHKSQPQTALLKNVQSLDEMGLLMKGMSCVFVDVRLPKVPATLVATFIGLVQKLALLGHDEAGAAKGQSGSAKAKAQELRGQTLFALCAAAQKQASDILPHWPTIFPELPSNERVPMTHPLLSPILRDSSPFARCGAAAAICAICARTLEQVQLAAEPKPSQRQAQSFTSISTRVGRTLVEVQAALVFGARSSGYVTRTMCLHTLSHTVPVLPYGRMPTLAHSIAAFAASPELLQSIDKGGPGNPGSTANGAPSNETTSALSFLTNLLKRSELQLALNRTLNSKHGNAMIEAIVGNLPVAEAWKAIGAVARTNPSVLSGIFQVPVQEIIAAIRNPDTPADRIVEAILACNNYMGLPWEAFEAEGQSLVKVGTEGTNWANTPASAIAPSVPTAVDVQHANDDDKDLFFRNVLKPGMTHHREAVRWACYRGLSQLQDSFLATLPTLERAAMVHQLINSGLIEDSPNTRQEAVATLGIWARAYPCMTEFHSRMVDAVVGVIYHEVEIEVLTKAAFALGNLAGRLPGFKVLDIPRVRIMAQGALLASRSPKLSVQSHAMRCMTYVLSVLPEDDLIMEIDGNEDGVPDAFLSRLIELLDSKEVKLRWNAVAAIGNALRRREVFAADPEIGNKAIEAAIGSIVRDTNFKVRSRATAALYGLPVATAAPHVMRFASTAMEALKHSLDVDNFKQFKDAHTLQGELRRLVRFLLEMYGVAESKKEGDRQFVNLNMTCTPKEPCLEANLEAFQQFVDDNTQNFYQMGIAGDITPAPSPSDSGSINSATNSWR